MQDQSPQNQSTPPVSAAPRRFLGFLLGRRRTLVVDPRYQLRMAGTAAALMLLGALLFAGAIHLENLRLHEIVSQHDPNIARALEDAGWTDLVLMATLAAGMTLGALLLALVETHRVAGPAGSLRRALARIQEGDYTTPVRVRSGDRLADLASSVDQLREALARATVDELDLLESLADRAETMKDGDEAAAIGGELRHQAARKRGHLGG